MNRENKMAFAVVGMLMAVVLAGFVVTGAMRSRGVPTADVVMAEPTATPAASGPARAAAADLLTSAATQRTAGQPGPALLLAEQALALWPDYAEADRFIVAVAPEATKMASDTQARDAAVARGAAAQVQVGAEARRLYSAQAQRPLQRYADAAGVLRQSTREARERPALMTDTVWRGRMEVGLATAQSAADEMVGLSPVPDGMAPAAVVLSQLNAELRLLVEELTPKLERVTADGIVAAASRLDRIERLTVQANMEVRRIGATP